MSEQVKQAAERLRLNNPINDAYSPFRDDMEEYYIPLRYMEDLQAVKAAYLAEHPEDEDEPIDAEWLRSAGFAEVESDLGPRYDSHFEISVPGKGRFNIWPSYGEWLISGFDSFPFKTRGDLRRLAASLSINLNQNS